MSEILRGTDSLEGRAPVPEAAPSAVRAAPSPREAITVGSAVVLLGVVGLLLAPGLASLGVPADPSALWITPPLGAAVALLLAAPRDQRPRCAQFVGLHGWALLAGLLGGWAAQGLDVAGLAPGAAYPLLLLAGAVTALQSLGGWALGQRHPPAHATALLVLLSEPTASSSGLAELGALAAGLVVCGALACPWGAQRP